MESISSHGCSLDLTGVAFVHLLAFFFLILGHTLCCSGATPGSTWETSAGDPTQTFCAQLSLQPHLPGGEHECAMELRGGDGGLSSHAQ